MSKRHARRERLIPWAGIRGGTGTRSKINDLEKGGTVKKVETTPHLSIRNIFFKRDDRLLCIYSSTLLSHSLPALNNIILTYNI